MELHEELDALRKHFGAEFCRYLDWRWDMDGKKTLASQRKPSQVPTKCWQRFGPSGRRGWRANAQA